jgi:ferredoxin-NADP reductase
MYEDIHEHVVVARRRETPTTTTLLLKKADDSIPEYVPGQCLTVYFLDLSQTLGKQYSISSAPCENACAITVKAIGRFSTRLCSLTEGDRILASGPSGSFYPTQKKNLVLLAGGMGVTPFRSIIIETLSRLAVPVRLFYSAKTAADMPFGAELYEASRQSRLCTIERFVTKGADFAPGIRYRRMRADDILNRDLHEGTEYLISGSLDFVFGLRNMLIGNGVSREHILTEAYF